MPNYVLLKKYKYMSKVINYYQSKNKRRISLRKINIGIFSLALIFGVFYLINISDLTVKGFALKDFKSQLAIVSDEVKDKQEQIDSLQSYYSLNSRAAKLNMVAVGNIDYISSSNIIVARK